MVARRTKLRPLLLAVAGTLSIALVLPPTTANGDVRARIVASGLNNPRGISLVTGRSYFVAEGGTGGAGPCQPGPFGTTCVGLTGAVTHVRDGNLDRIGHLPSIASPDGSFAFGPHDVAVGDDGALFTTVGLGGTLAYRNGFLGRQEPASPRSRALLGAVTRASSPTSWRTKTLTTPPVMMSSRATPTGSCVRETPASSPTRERTIC